nr:hypothetical protein [uncultured Draconibacterium sp.]
MTKEEILIKDYESTQAFIDKADSFLFWIRNWAIVLCSAVIVFAVTNHSAIILLSNILIICGFLFVELIQKSFHEDALKHSYEVEKIIQESVWGNKPFPTNYQFGLGHSINTVTLKRLKSILFHRGRWHNVAFYLLILFFSLTTLLIIPFVPETTPKEKPQIIKNIEYNIDRNEIDSTKVMPNEEIKSNR